MAQIISLSSTFDDYALQAMGAAFENARALLPLATPTDLETIARRIVAAARRGERDPETLCDQAIIALRTSGWEPAA